MSAAGSSAAQCSCKTGGDNENPPGESPGLGQPVPNLSPANAGNLDGECQKRHASETRTYVSGDADGDDAGQDPHAGKGSIWPASFLLTNIRGLVQCNKLQLTRS